MTGPDADRDGAQRCWLCARPLGRRTEWHHPVPKSHKGREVVPVHPICHQAIHANFSNAELQRGGGSAESLRGHAELARFLRWIAGKPPDFHARTASRRR